MATNFHSTTLQVQALEKEVSALQVRSREKFSMKKVRSREKDSMKKVRSREKISMKKERSRAKISMTEVRSRAKISMTEMRSRVKISMKAVRKRLLTFTNLLGRQSSRRHRPDSKKCSSGRSRRTALLARRITS